MNTTILQIPMSTSLKKNATETAKKYGFSSLQECVRFLLTKLVRNEMIITVQEVFKK